MKSPLLQSLTFSQSSLQDYSDCARRFLLRHVNRLTWPAVESEPIEENELRQEEGGIFHRMIHQYWLGLPIDKINQMAKSENLITWWQNFQDYDFNIGENSIHPEVSLVVPIKAYRLSAKFDLIAISSNKVIIFDWKTNQKLPRRDWLVSRYQTRVYCALLAYPGLKLGKETGFPPEKIEMVYWMANFPQNSINIQYSEKKYLYDWSHIESLVTQIESEIDFPKTSDLKKCGYCSFRSYCDRGASALVLEDDSESDQTSFDITWDKIETIEF